MTEFFRRINETAGSPAKQRAAKDMIGEAVVFQVRRRFDTEGASGGKMWKKKLSSNGYPTLGSATHHLRDSFKPRVTGRQVEVYTTVPYARLHQWGTTGKGGLLPPVTPKKAKKLFIPISDRARQGRTVPTFAPMMGHRTGFFSRLKYGVDYVLADKAEYPPRPMFPDSPQERVALGRVIALATHPLYDPIKRPKGWEKQAL